MFNFLFHLECKLLLKTALKFKQYYPTVNKVKYLLPKLSTVEKSITFNIANKFYFRTNLIILLKGNVRYWPSKLNIVLRRRCFFFVFFCVISCKRFRLLLVHIYAKFEGSIGSFSKQIAFDRCHSHWSARLVYVQFIFSIKIYFRLEKSMPRTLVLQKKNY